MRFELDEQQRDFAASIDAALGAADVPGAVRAWSAGDVAPGRKVWEQLANLGVTALAVPAVIWIAPVVGVTNSACERYPYTSGCR